MYIKEGEKFLMESKDAINDIKKNILVIGLGNTLLPDECVGVQAVDVLKSSYQFPNSVEIVDGGTMGVELFSYFQDRSDVIIVDTVNAGKEPGTIIRIEEDIPEFFQVKMSPNQIGLADIFSIASLTENPPKNIVMFGLEPKKMTTDLPLSSEESPNVEKLVSMVVDELKDLGVRAEKSSTKPEKKLPS